MDLNSLGKRIYDELKRSEKKKTVTNHISDFYNTTIVEKDIRQSQRARAEGDKLFAEDNLEIEHQHKIIRSYNESIAYAPLGSEELAKTYANKSALLRRMRRYSECISEADKALKISQSIPMKIKLLCRKAECHTALGSLDYTSCLEKAKFAMTRSEMDQESQKMKKMLHKLIEKTQEVVNENKLDKPKEVKRYAQTLKEVANVKDKNFWQHSVKVDYSENYGLYLVAARDFEPGEVILQERPYHYYLQYDRTYQYCYHCLNYLWTVVPCGQCNWREYCSEKCRNQSWDEYHELECFVSSKLKTKMNAAEGHDFFVLSLFFKTLKEAGSLGQLIADIELLDQKGGRYFDEISSVGGFNYKTIYASPLSVEVTEEMFHIFCKAATGTLVAIGMFSKIFGNDFYYCKNVLKKMMKDKTAISVGALLMKLGLIAGDRQIRFKLTDPTNFDSTIIKEGSPPEWEVDDSYSFLLDSLTSMMIAGCIPNVKSSWTREHSLVWHSLQPIKEGDKLNYFTLHTPIYMYIPKTTRQLQFQQRYKCSCDCRACTEEWPLEHFRYWTNEAKTEDEAVLAQLRNECNYYRMLKQNRSSKMYNPDVKTMLKVKDLLSRAWKHCEMPSTIIFMAVRIFYDVSGYFYGHSRHDYK